MTEPRRKRLGRGLDALLGGAAVAPEEEQRLRQVPVDLLKRGQYQPRTRMDKTALEELAQSISARGVVQPIVARPLSDGGYEIIAGERRWRAAQLAGLSDVPVVVRDIPDEAAMAIALKENIHGQNRTPNEDATGIKRLLDEFGLTHEQAASGVGRSRSAVTNLLRLLTLGVRARELLENGGLEMGHARALLTLPREEQEAVAVEIAAKRWSVRQAEERVRRIQKAEKSGKAGPRPVPADIRDLQERLSEKLGAKVTVQDNKGAGKVVIEYHSLSQLDGILDRIR
jgi:ParB family chromosome partitioning protein